MFHSRRGRASRAIRSLRPLVAIIATLLFLAVPLSVAAHAELDTMTPTDGATVNGSPTQVVATFTEELDAGASNLRLVNAAGAVVLEGGEVGGDGKTLTLAVTTPLDPGAYTVRWTSKSADDGDLDHGTTTFTVAAVPSVEPSLAPSAAPSSLASVVPSAVPSIAPSPAASAAPSTPATSTSDIVIPIAAALVVLVIVGGWLLRGRGRTVR